jgi:hypothetical protein
MKTKPFSPLTDQSSDRLFPFGELFVTLGILFGYTLITLILWGRLEPHYDSPGYTDPSASYLLGQGFTSGCWYLQGNREFWAGNVPLHQLLLIPWFKLAGFSYFSVKLLNSIYLSMGMILLWLGMRSGKLVISPLLRIGAVGFFLCTNSAYTLETSGRPEPLCFLIACASWYFFNSKGKLLRWSGLGLCGVLAPWAGLPLAAFFAFAGLGTILIYRKKYFIDVLALAFGGIIGTLALLLFYRSMGVLEIFLANISPHTNLLTGNNKHQTAAYFEWSKLMNSRDWKLGGFRSNSLLWIVLISMGVSLTALISSQARKLAIVNISCFTLLPSLFLLIGVFPYYYSYYIILPLTLSLFGLISAGVIKNQLMSRALILILIAGAFLPGNYLWIAIVQGLPCSLHTERESKEEFIERSVYPNDVAWVDHRFWFETKPRARETFSGLWRLQAETSPSLERITVVIFPESSGANSGGSLLPYLPGHWEKTGETLQLPDFHRIIRYNNNNHPLTFFVFRKVDS